MRFKACLSLVLMAFLSAGPIMAQESSCIEVLTKARESFERGHLYGIPAQLKPCLDGGFNKSQRIEAYYLLSRVYLLIDDPISAEDSYLKLLKLDPEYNIDEDRDPVDIVYLDKKFTTTPIFVLFAKAGANLTKPQVIHNFGVDNTALTQESYSGNVGFQFAAGAELNINDHFSLGLEFMLAQKRYLYENNLFNGDIQTLEERLLMVSAPIYVKYRIEFQKIRPFVYLGYSNEYFFSAQGNLSLIDKVSSVSDEDMAEFPVTGPDVNMIDQRNSFNSSLLAGIGSNYRIGYNYVFIDIRYSLGLSNIVDIDSQYANEELLYKYGYVDDYKRLNSIEIMFGFVKPLYKPRKKSSKKNLLKRLFNKK